MWYQTCFCISNKFLLQLLWLQNCVDLSLLVNLLLLLCLWFNVCFTLLLVEGQHRTEVHMLLPRSAEPLTPLRVKVLPGDNKIAGTTYTLLAQSNSLDQSHGSESIRLSPVRAKSLTRECRRTARRLLGKTWQFQPITMLAAM